MIENTILKANREGRKALVFSMTYKDLWAVEAAAQAGFDAISLDGEHGAFSSSDVDDIVRVANGSSNASPNTTSPTLSARPLQVAFATTSDGSTTGSG